ncbi:MAG: glycosyl transferase family 90 [Pseudomonadota bacterium]
MAIRLLFILVFANLSFAQELKVITPESYLNENSSLEREAIVDFIVHQFDGKKVSQAELDKLWNDKEIRKKQHLARFQIINQKLYAETMDISRIYFLKLLEYLDNFVKRYKINDVDFIVYARDEITPNNNIEEELLRIPAFMMSKNLKASYEQDKLLMPDAHIIKKHWGIVSNEIKKENTLSPWDKKINKIFWRGASTGGAAEHMYNISNFDKFARLKLVFLSKLYPDLIDAKMNRFADFSTDQDGKSLRNILSILFGNDKIYIKEVDHLKYKYLIAIDGNTCPWVRVPWIMLSNSVLVKQETQKIEWFYPAIKPYVHYVPVKEDLTDIFAQIEWMKANDEKVKEISENAQKFVNNELMPENIDAQMAIILNEYSKIQQDKRIVATITPADDVISIKAFILVIGNRIKKYFWNLFH